MADRDTGDGRPAARVDGGDEPVSLHDLELGLRFGHAMEAQGRIEQSELAVELSALIDLLIAKGVISARELDERKRIAREQQAERDKGRLFHTLNDEDVEKRTLVSPEIPCLELLPTCRGACCSLSFSLSLEDLHEGSVRWDLSRPYHIRTDPDTGLCFHFDGCAGCRIWEDRPAVCRRYDCRTDSRIWKDFDAREPTDLVAKLPPVTPREP